MTTLQQYLIINGMASLYGEGVYNCNDYNNATNCTATTTTPPAAGGTAPAKLAGTGMDVYLIGGIVLAILLAGVFLLVKRMRRNATDAK